MRPAARPALAAALAALGAGALGAAPGDAASDAAATVPAVARLNHAGYRERQHCSASLIGPREVVTARHCVEGLAADELHVLLGYDRGGFAEHRRVASVQASEAHDIARLCLDSEPSMTPLAPSAERPAPGPAEVRGYPSSRAHAQGLRACALAPLADQPLAVLDCPLEQGMSGAPVAAGEGAAARVTGVVSATGGGESVVVLLGALPEGGCEPPA